MSGSTLQAVSRFCTSISSAGIRDRFLRLNLFCGTGLNAALVPLYRGPSLVGTQYGGATETNDGPFVDDNFSEDSGLKGDGTTKSLDTGLAQTAGSLADLHLSASFTELEASGTRGVLTNNGGTVSPGDFVGIQPETEIVCFLSSFAGDLTTTRTTAVSHLLASRSSTTRADLYVDGASVDSSTETVTTAPQATTYRLFARKDGASIQLRTAMRLRFYSVGFAIDGASATAFANAVANLNTALGR